MNDLSQLVSIIVPVYNTQDYIAKCLESILSQTYTNIEVVIIDDGSEDDSYKICKAFSDADQRIRIIRQENRGLSEARNVGVKYSKGNFILFVDSDDWISAEMVKYLISAINMYHTDIAICDLKMMKQGKKEHQVKSSKSFTVQNYINPSATYNLFKKGFYYSHACAKLFKRELWDLTAFPKGKKYEDLFTIPKVISKAKCVSYLDYPGYYYLVRSGSLLNRDYSIHDDDYLEAYSENIMCFSDALPEVIPYLESKWCEAYVYVYNKIHFSNHAIDDVNHFEEKYNSLFMLYSKRCLKNTISTTYFFMIKLLRANKFLYNSFLSSLAFIKRTKKCK